MEVNVRNSSVTYDGNDIRVSFDLTNGKGAQSGIRYGVQLMKADTVIDEKLFDEVIDIGENETVSKNVLYEAPNFFQGLHQLRVIVKSESGSPLAFGINKGVALGGTGKYLNIDNSSCFLSIKGEKGSYTLQQGVDVSPEEVLLLNCKVLNNFDKKVDFNPFLKHVIVLLLVI